MAALHGRGLLEDLDGRRLETLEGNAGFVAAAMRLFSMQGWVHLEEGCVRLTPSGRRMVDHADLYAVSTVEAPVEKRPWAGLADEQIAGHLDGHLVAPRIARLHGAGVLGQALQGRVPICDSVLEAVGWVDRDGSLTAEGRLALKLGSIYAYAAAYAPTLRAVPDLLFGDAHVLRRRTDRGHETHVDRTQDVAFSGDVFSSYVARPFLEVFLPLFGGPGGERPRAIIDVGCGDGRMLRALYEAVGRRETDVALAAVEYNDEAREAAARTLQGLPHVLLPGDVNDAAGIAKAVERAGVDTRAAVWVCKSVIHNRSWSPPREPSVRTPHGEEVFVHPDGGRIPNEAMEQNLLEFFQRWRRVAGRHGIVAVEAHATRPEIAAEQRGRTLATLLESTHLYSGQFLVEEATYTAAARAAGFTSRARRVLGREVFGHPYMTIDHFVG